MSDEKTPTPIPIHVRKNQEGRIQELERDRGVIARDISKLWDMVHHLVHRIGVVEKKQNPGADETTDDRPSQVDLSIRPNRIRASLKNQPFLSLLTTLLILSLTAITIVWLLKRK